MDGDLVMNFLNLTCSDTLESRSTKRTLSLSSHPTSGDQSDCLDYTTLWPLDHSPWSQQPSKSFRQNKPDRSLSLTDASLSGFGGLKGLSVPPPPGFAPLTAPAPQNSNRYKTELCRSFQENGNCKYGNKCQFAHGTDELRMLSRHPKYKTQACRTFYSLGYCPYGSRCHFIHDKSLESLQMSHPDSSSPHARTLRQSVSFAGFPGPRSSSPPTPHDLFAFCRAPSVSPPPAELLSPVFSEAGLQSPASGFQFTAKAEPTYKAPETQQHMCCSCGRSKTTGSKSPPSSLEQAGSFVGRLGMQRFSSEDSLSDPDGYSSSGSLSGSESPSFESSGSLRRLTVFTRMSLSD
ncbi:mRNA decay activator protein ZFP36 [Erpetoichthys calabaricus]|uniref:mRNA decay activator protein ZFP36 n=1 Tax=Erpetoichthys calabaricus TaxID=27687 RepID=A0A8C4RDW6_ERPCA|nr:mRNA decay activator protein ZFP36 [Erpetoichthys calabaricus]